MSSSTDICFEETNKHEDWSIFLESGESDFHDRVDGLWYRNFSDSEYSRRYPEDTEFEFGFKIKAAFVKCKPQDRMSVNCANCTSSLKCSPLLQSAHPAKPCIHTAIIDLALLRDAYEEMCREEDLDLELPYAHYAPINSGKQKNGELHPGNPCHYDLCLDVVEKTDLVIFRRCLQNSLKEPIPEKLPRESEGKKRAGAALELHNKLISLRCDVVAIEDLAGRY